MKFEEWLNEQNAKKKELLQDLYVLMTCTEMFEAGKDTTPSAKLIYDTIKEYGDQLVKEKIDEDLTFGKWLYQITQESTKLAGTINAYYKLTIAKQLIEQFGSDKIKGLWDFFSSLIDSTERITVEEEGESNE